MAGPAGGGAPTYRANMMRRAPAARPAAAAARPRVMKAKATGSAVRKARPVRKASVHRPARKATPRVRRAAAPSVAPVFRALPAPTPMPVAAYEMATPRAYALIATTICETGPRALGAPEAAVPVLAIAPGGGPPTDDLIPGTDTETTLPPISRPDFPGPGPTGPTGGGGGPGPTPPPGVEPPLVEPPVTEPPFVEPPIGPPGEEPPVFPPGEEPPIFPPTGPPVIEPPTGPPILEPPTTPVPEPASWALMILGFGLLGARLRATSSAASGSPGRVGSRG